MVLFATSVVVATVVVVGVNLWGFAAGSIPRVISPETVGRHLDGGGTRSHGDSGTVISPQINLELPGHADAPTSESGAPSASLAPVAPAAPAQ